MRNKNIPMNFLTTKISALILSKIHRTSYQIDSKVVRVYRFLLALFIGNNKAKEFIGHIYFQKSREPFHTTKRLCGYVDRAEIETNLSTCSLNVEGWLFDTKQQISSLVVFYGQKSSLADIHILSEHVHASFPHVKHSRRAIFNARIAIDDLSEFENNLLSSLKLKVVLANGELVYGDFPINIEKPNLEFLQQEELNVEKIENFTESDLFQAGFFLDMPKSREPIFLILIEKPVDLSAYYDCLTSLKRQGIDDVQIEVFSFNQKENDSKFETKISGIGLHSISRYEDLNSLINSSTAHYILFVDGNVSLSDSYLQDLLSFYGEGAHEEACLVSGMLRSTKGTILEAGCILAATGEYRAYGRNKSESDSAVLYERSGVMPSPVLFSTSKEKFMLVGGFTNNFDLNLYNKIDLFLRLRNKGVKSVYNPRLIASAKSLSYKDSLLNDKDRENLYALHHETLNKLLPDDTTYDLFARSSYSRSESILIFLDHEESISFKKRVKAIIDQIGHKDGTHISLAVSLDGTVSVDDIYTVYHIPRTVEIILLKSSQEIIPFFESRPVFYSTILVVGTKAMNRYYSIFSKKNNGLLSEIWFEPLVSSEGSDAITLTYSPADMSCKEYMKLVDCLVFSDGKYLSDYTSIISEKIIIS